jgi:hypothetical protein
MHATVAKPGQWFGPVTRLGWLDPVQPLKRKQIKKKDSFLFLENSIFMDLFIGPRVRNTVLFGLHNIYQR